MRCRSAERVAHSRVKFQPRVDETLRWKVPADPGNPGNQVSSATVRNHSNTLAGGGDYVSSNQTPSNDDDGDDDGDVLMMTMTMTSTIMMMMIMKRQI